MSGLPTIEEELLTFIHMELGLPRGRCRPDEPLFSSGLLDSFAMVSLLAHAEERFGVALLDSDALLEIDTARTLAAHIHRSLSR
jgi:acyl carrier protein